MTKNPYLNALLAGAYIVAIVLVVSTFADNPSLENSKYVLLIPMTMLSLFVFSAALMGFLFLSRPLALYLDNKKHEAVVFFAKTLGTFAVCVLIFLSLLLSKI
jgi:hypothetical protein